MLKRFTSKLLLNKILTLMSLSFTLLTMPALAGKEDFKLPVKVESNKNFVDGKRKTSVFKENVNITQGTLKIHADEVQLSAEAGKGKEVFIALGSPAIYSQTMDDGSQVTARAKEIRYAVENRTLELFGDAELIQDTSSVKGENISFNLEKEQLIAGGESSEGRVTTVFQTNDNEE